MASSSSKTIISPERPVFDVGLPKSGTTSVYDYMVCGGYRSSHWTCDAVHEFCGVCARANFDAGRPLLQGCGGYEVWAEINVTPCANGTACGDAYAPLATPQNECFFPQLSALPQLHAAYPHATWVLTLRPARHWAASLANWWDLQQRLAACDLPGLPRGVGAAETDLISFFDNHTARVREFAAAHPSLRLVEIHVEGEHAASSMQHAFGVAQSCWGKSNCQASCRLWDEIFEIEARERREADSAQQENVRAVLPGDGNRTSGLRGQS